MSNPFLLLNLFAIKKVPQWSRHEPHGEMARAPVRLLLRINGDRRLMDLAR